MKLYEGYLWKKARGESSFGRRNWKKRWFVLNDTKLIYYEEIDMNSSKPTGWKGEFEMINSSVEEVEHHEREFTFLIKSERGELLLCAPNYHTMMKWFNVLKVAAQGKKAFTSFYVPSPKVPKSLPNDFDLNDIPQVKETKIKKFTDLLIEVEIKKLSSGYKGLGLTFENKEDSTETIIQEFTNNNQIVHIKPEKAITLLKGDILISIGSYSLKDVSTKRALLKLSDARVPVDSTVNLTFKRIVEVESEDEESVHDLNLESLDKYDESFNKKTPIHIKNSDFSQNDLSCSSSPSSTKKKKLEKSVSFSFSKSISVGLLDDQAINNQVSSYLLEANQHKTKDIPLDQPNNLDQQNDQPTYQPESETVQNIDQKNNNETKTEVIRYPQDIIQLNPLENKNLEQNILATEEIKIVDENSLNQDISVSISEPLFIIHFTGLDNKIYDMPIFKNDEYKLKTREFLSLNKFPSSFEPIILQQIENNLNDLHNKDEYHYSNNESHPSTSLITNTTFQRIIMRNPDDLQNLHLKSFSTSMDEDHFEIQPNSSRSLNTADLRQSRSRSIDSKRRSYSTSPVNLQNRGSVYDRLYNFHKLYENRKIKLKSDIHSQRQDAILSSSHRSKSPRKVFESHNASLEAINQIYYDQINKKNKIIQSCKALKEKKRIEREAEELDGATFTPNITSNYRMKTPTKPFFESLEKRYQDYSSRLQRSADKHNKVINQHLTFHPQRITAAREKNSSSKSPSNSRFSRHSLSKTQVATPESLGYRTTIQGDVTEKATLAEFEGLPTMVSYEYNELEGLSSLRPKFDHRSREIVPSDSNFLEKVMEFNSAVVETPTYLLPEETNPEYSLFAELIPRTLHKSFSESNLPLARKISRSLSPTSKSISSFNQAYDHKICVFERLYPQKTKKKPSHLFDSNLFTFVPEIGEKAKRIIIENDKDSFFTRLHQQNIKKVKNIEAHLPPEPEKARITLNKSNELVSRLLESHKKSKSNIKILKSQIDNMMKEKAKEKHINEKSDMIINNKITQPLKEIFAVLMFSMECDPLSQVENEEVINKDLSSLFEEKDMNDCSRNSDKDESNEQDLNSSFIKPYHEIPLVKNDKKIPNTPPKHKRIVVEPLLILKNVNLEYLKPIQLVEAMKTAFQIMSKKGLKHLTETQFIDNIKELIDNMSIPNLRKLLIDIPKSFQKENQIEQQPQPIKLDLKAKPKSENLIKERYADLLSGKKSIEDTLFEYGVSYQNNINVRKANYESLKYAECTFQPTIIDDYLWQNLKRKNIEEFNQRNISFRSEN